MAKSFEFLDHTADVQIHAWGSDLKEAFESAALSLSDYISELHTIEGTGEPIEISVSGHDLYSLLYAFLDEVLFQFNAEYFICSKIVIEKINLESFTIEAKLFGEPFSIGKHPQGTEIKAITYSNMQIHQNDNQVDIYVIVDI